MKKFKRLTALVLSLILILPVLSSCKGDGEIVDSAPLQNETENSTTDTQSTAPSDFIALDDGYVLSYEKTADAAVELTVEALKKTIYSTISKELSISLEKNGALSPASDKEIFIGKSQREAYASAYEGLDYGEWRIKTIGESVILAANNTTAALDAVEYFKAQYIKNANTKA